ncbi:MAG: T9SS type A sorting domain-containing protein [Saprospiraceae bacterium]|nr:T9SS type A sorting domain-containing protein [Saprospiraceae bacterium]
MPIKHQLKVFVSALIPFGAISYSYACGPPPPPPPNPTVTISTSGGTGICSSSNGYTIDIGNATGATISLFGGEVLSFPSSCGGASATTSGDINGEYIFLNSSNTFSCAYAINVFWPNSFALIRVTATNANGSTSKDYSVSPGLTVSKIAGSECSPPMSLSASGAIGASISWTVNSTSGDPLPTLSTTNGPITHVSNIQPGVFTVTATANCGGQFKDQYGYNFVSFACLQSPNLQPDAKSSTQSFNVFPNPVQSGQPVNLRLPSAESTYDVRLLQQNGTLIKQWNGFDPGSTIPTDLLPAGIYLIQLMASDGQHEMKKLVINR